MPASSGIFWIIPILILGLVFHATPALAFGAGNIPSYAYLEGKAFRHGDIEDILAELARGSGGAAGLLGAMTGGLLAKKWSGLDIKRVYFGNWLRDYSQAMDVAGLSKLSEQAIINLVMVLGFLAHGYATGEFEVTPQRLGVYLPVEHIDNPFGYNDNKDARQVHPKLRPPIDPQELEVDPRTGMMNYIANENGHWDTSKACVRRTLLACIDMGRKAKHGGGGNEALYEAYRLLGTALHTLEDFSAHSNYCELALQKLGYHQVYDHVGSNVRVRAPNGKMVAPLVTGSFGGADFLHSLLGEAGDHISSASVSDLNKQMDKARSQNTDRGFNNLRTMFDQLPGGNGLSRDLDNATRATNTGKNPMEMSPQELHAVLWQVLTFRDNVSKFIEQTIEKIPGLGSLIEKIGDSLATFVFVTLEPYIKPIMQQATGVLQQGSSQVVNSQDQYRVFNDPNFPHPTHSLLAKDHFNGILNEPAGNIAKLIVRHVVKDVVEAWDNPSNDPHQHIENILACLYHPAFNTGAPIQNEMEAYMRSWIDSEDKNYTLNGLSKDGVRNGKNHRKGHASEKPTTGPGGYTSFLPTPQHLQSQASGFVQQQLHGVPGYNQFQSGMQQFHNVFPGSQGGGGRREMDPNDYDPYNQTYQGQPMQHQPPPQQQPMYGGGPQYGQQQGFQGGPPPQQPYGAAPSHGQGMYGAPQYQQQPPYGQYQQDSYGNQGSHQPPPSGRW